MFKVVFGKKEIITPSYNDAMATARNLVESTFYENREYADVFEDGKLLGYFCYEDPQVSFVNMVDNSD